MNRAAKIKLAGTFYGAAAAACYGMNPLFALPLYHRGMGVNSVLFYRYVFALVLLFVWLKFFKKVCEKLLTVCVENARINLALEGTAKK